MQYRKFGKTGKDVSILGFGCMRLPVLGGNPGNIDEEKAAAMLHYAIENGVNYIDTAYTYHSSRMLQAGMSEVFVGKVLNSGYRDRVYIATKLPGWIVRKREEMDYYLNEQLKRIQTGKIDFYLLHGLNAQTWPHLKRLGVTGFLDSALKDGRIAYAGFSFHDDLSVFKEIVDSYDWHFCQIQYNYMDENFQAGREGLEYACHKDLGVVIMEPVRGGALAGNIPAEIQEIWGKAPIRRTPAEWALRYTWDHPGVGVVLSGMTKMEHVVENVRVAADAGPNSLTDQEKGLIQEVRDAYNRRTRVHCSACNYCMPCPSGVNIPNIFRLLNSVYIFDDFNVSNRSYGFLKARKGDASNCSECGQCEEACPQNISIREKLQEAGKTFNK